MRTTKWKFRETPAMTKRLSAYFWNVVVFNNEQSVKRILTDSRQRKKAQKAIDVLISLQDAMFAEGEK